MIACHRIDPQPRPKLEIVDWVICFDCSECRGRDDSSDMPTVPTHVQMMSQLMQAAEVRHRVISQNIANVNTPNYLARDVEFEAELAERLKAGDAAGIHRIQPEVRLQEGLVTRADGNNVDIDREIGRLNKNSLLYQTYSQVTAAYYDSMRRAIRTG